MKEDPIFIPIFQLEKEKSGGKAPTNFSIVENGMRNGSALGSLFVADARKGVSATYFYAALNDSEFGFAFSLSPTDQVWYDCNCNTVQIDTHRAPESLPAEVGWEINSIVRALCRGLCKTFYSS